MELFKSKYRIESARLKDWDYSDNAKYFITICTAYKECHFGEIIDSQMELSDIGKIAQEFLIHIHSHFDYGKTD